MECAGAEGPLAHNPHNSSIQAAQEKQIPLISFYSINSIYFFFSLIERCWVEDNYKNIITVNLGNVNMR